MPVTITLAQFTDIGARPSMVDLFSSTYGESASFDTLEEFREVCKLYPLDYLWASYFLLTTSYLDEFYTQIQPISLAYQLERLSILERYSSSQDADAYIAEKTSAKTIAEDQFAEIFAALFWEQENAVV